MIRICAVACLILLSACQNPMLTAEMAIGNDGVSVRPALSGDVGNATISIEAN